MKFSLEAIQEAHSKFTGVDFPKLIGVFKEMGMSLNTFDIEKGLITYTHKDGSCIETQGLKVEVPVSQNPSKTQANEVLKRHQAGQTDFVTFCREIAEAGVYKWVSDMDAMTCSYYDLKDLVVVVEEIPTA